VRTYGAVSVSPTGTGSLERPRTCIAAGGNGGSGVVRVKKTPYKHELCGAQQAVVRAVCDPTKPALRAASNTMTSVPQTDMLRTVSGAYEQLQIISLCRDSNPSAEALAQLLRNPSCFAGVNYADDSQKSPLIEGERLRSSPKHSLWTLQVSIWSLTCSSATVRGHIHLLPLLISSGADLNHMATFQSTVKQTFSALHIAIVTGQLDAVKLLLQSGSALVISNCGVSSIIWFYSMQNSSQCCALHLVTPFCFTGASLHVIDAHGRSPWSLALLPEAPVQDLHSDKLMRKEQDKHSSISGVCYARSSRDHMCSLSFFAAYIRSLADLLEICKSATPSLEAARTCFFDEPDLSRLRITFETSMGYTPLHEASRRGLTDIVAFLLEQKANVNAVSFVKENSSLIVRDSGEAPLHLAAANGHWQVAELLIRARADIATLTTMGQSALLLCFGADGKHHFEVANVIVEEIIKLREADSNKASSVINCSDAFKVTALHAAAGAGALPIVQLLLSVKEIDVNKANIDGHTPFHSAASSGNSFVVRAIAKHGQIDVNKPVKSKLQDSPIHLAAKRGNVDVLIELGILGAHLVKEITDSAGKPIPLQFISNGSAERPFPIDVAQGEARSFLEMAFDLFSLCQREPASSRAVSIKDILAAPRTRRAFLNFRTTLDNTPLHIAVISNNYRGWGRDCVESFRA
jgi:ankyrin repeat protein